tara:strand:- start:93 stop:275 length:183 start_codon:yes stop_codon:yes gene_type:complete
MTGKAELTIRRRASVSRTSRGFSVDITIEGHGMSNDEILAETKALFAMVDEAFPATEVKK